MQTLTWTTTPHRQGHGQLDASLSYELSSAITIGLDAQNLTRNELKDYYGTAILPKSVNAFDRTFEFSIRASF